MIVAFAGAVRLVSVLERVPGLPVARDRAFVTQATSLFVLASEYAIMALVRSERYLWTKS